MFRCFLSCAGYFAHPQGNKGFQCKIRCAGEVFSQENRQTKVGRAKLNAPLAARDGNQHPK
jgi:hypothetical protein